jgi:uncharacterized protein (DUF1778 family)
MKNQTRVLKLSAEDSRAFVDAILNPKEPNQKLKDAAVRYKREFGNVEIKITPTSEGEG